MSIQHDVYPSRVHTEPQILDRQDPVVYSDGDPDGEYLTKEQVEQFRRDGFLVMKDLFSPEEVEAFVAELQTLAESEEIRNADEAITEPNSGIVRSIFRIHRLSDLYRRLSRDPRLVKPVRFLLNDDIYIHQSRVNMKPGFAGKEFYWHSDFETWHVEDGLPRMRTISASIALTPNYPYNGPLMLIPGSHMKYVSCVGKTPEDHYKKSLKKQEFGVPDHGSLRKLADEGGIEAPTGNAGTVVFFDCNTMHGSNGNITPYPRSNAFFVFNSLENRAVDPFGGMRPRPEFIGAREEIDVIE